MSANQEQAMDAAPSDTTEQADEVAEAEGFPEWHLDPENPLNWPARKKTLLVVMMSLQALTA